MASASRTIPARCSVCDAAKASRKCGRCAFTVRARFEGHSAYRLGPAKARRKSTAEIRGAKKEQAYRPLVRHGVPHAEGRLCRDAVCLKAEFIARGRGIARPKETC